MTGALAGMPVGGGAGRSSFDRVVDALQARTGPTTATKPMEVKARCPVHDDRTPSLSVRWTRGDRGGLVLLNCHGCGARAVDLVEALGLSMADLFDEPLPARAGALRGRAGRPTDQRRSGARRGRLGRLPALLAAPGDLAPPDAVHEWVTVATYPYLDAAGGLVQEVVREECTACPARHKTFRQLFVVGGARRKRKPDGFVPVLYRLPQVLAAVAAGQPVWLLEGEKDVETAERLGLVATTNTGGGRGFPGELAAVLRGADVRVVLDRDDAGWDRGVALHQHLGAVEATVRLFLPATTAPKSDFTDHVDAGENLGDLVPVHVEEVAAWAALAGARRKHLAVEQALAQTQGQLAAAEDAVRARDQDAAAEHTRFARRWASETEIRWEALRGLVEDVRQRAVRTGTEWAGEAIEVAAGVLRQARTAARAAHDAAGVPVPPSLADDPGTGPGTGDDPGGGHDGDWDAQHTGEARAGVAIQSPTYRIVNRHIVEVVSPDRAKRGRREPDPADGEEGEETLRRVLSLDVQIVEMEYLEDPDTVDVDAPRLQGRRAREEQRELNPPGPAELSAVTVCYTDPANGDRCTLRVPADDYRDCGWVESLPGPPQYDSKPSGLAKLRDAIKAVSTGIRRTTRYRSTGWRLLEGRWCFVHAQGAITAEGVRPVPVLLTGPLARYDLPDPSEDPARLRAAFLEHSAAMLTLLPARVAAPLLGHVYRSAMGPNPWVLALIGSAGSYKTSIASLGMHHWGELWDRRKPASSMSGNGDTLNALRIKLNSAKDALYWADDVAPTRDWASAQKTLEEFARLVHNGEQRSRSTRDGLAVLDGTPPRSSALITSEVMPRPGSGAQRMLVVPLQAEETDLEALIALDGEESRHGRALLMASMLRWLAGNLEATRARCLGEAARYAETLREAGETVRQAEAVGHTWAGWVCATDFLLEMGAITDQEREQVLARVDQGLRDAVEASADPDLPTRTGARVRELIVHALRTGIAYVEDVRSGDAPGWPLAGRLGWRRTPMGRDETGETRYRVESKGIRFGYLLDDPGVAGGRQLLVESTALDQVLKATGTAMADAPQLDRGTALRALHDEGVLIGEKRVNRPDRLTVQRTLHCEDNRRARVTALRLGALLGDDPDAGEIEPVGGGPDSGPDTTARTGGWGFGPGPSDPTNQPGVDDSQHQPLGSETPDQGLTSPQHEELPVSTRISDAEGFAATIGHPDRTEPCLFCGLRCGVFFLELAIHVPCWERSTAASRNAAIAARHTPPPDTSPAPAPAPKPMQDPAQAHATGPDRPVDAAPRAARPAPVIPPTTAPAGSPRDPRERTMAGGYAGPAAVLHTDGVWLPDGTRIDVPDPLRHVGHIAELVERLRLGTQVTKWRAEPGQIWVTGAAAGALGLDVDALPADPTKRVEAVRGLTRGTPLVTGALDEGWQVGKPGDCLSAWTRVWRGEARGVWVALIPAMNADPLEIPVLGDTPAPGTLAQRLTLFAGALGAPWAMSPSSTGLDLMISLRAKDRDRLFTPREPVPPARIPNLENDLNWSRVPTAQEQACRFVHAYDRGGSYAAGIAGLELGIGPAVHYPQGRPFDAKLPGYWQIEVPEAGDWRMPHPLNPRGALPARPVWVTTPTLAFAIELGHEAPILSAHVWPEHARVLDPWYERVRDARTALDVADVNAQTARDLLKVVYTRTIGMLGSEEWMRNRPGYAPDRRHHIVAKARANILRRIVQIGRAADRWPVAVTADTLLYVSDQPDPVDAWPGKPAQLGRGFGQFKPEASGLLVEQLAHLNGRDYRGKELLDHDWAPPEVAAAGRAS